VRAASASLAEPGATKPSVAEPTSAVAVAATSLAELTSAVAVAAASLAETTSAVAVAAASPSPSPAGHQALRRRAHLGRRPIPPTLTLPLTLVLN